MVRPTGNRSRVGRVAALALACSTICLALTACSAQRVAIRPPADGSYEGFLREVNPQTGRVDFEQVHMLVGAAARPACRTHHIPNSAPCAFFINDLHIASKAKLAVNAEIKSQLSPNGTGISFAGYPLTRAQLVPLIKSKAAYSDTPFRIIVQHGQIVSMLGLYHP